MGDLTDRQKKFVKFYDGNATQAAIKAGFSKKTAAAHSSRLLRNVKIKKAIKSRTDKIDAPIIASRLDRQKFWTDMMQAQMKDDGDRLKASELLGRSEGDFTEKIQHSGGVVMAMGRVKKGGKVLAFQVGSSARPA